MAKKEASNKRKTSTISTPKQWEQTNNQTKVITLPSGATVKVKVLDILDLVVVGHIPLPLLNNTLKIAGSFDKQSENPFSSLEDGQLQDLIQMMKMAAAKACIEPKVSMNGKEGSVSVDKISSTDLFAIFDASVNTGGGAGLGNFFR